MEYRLLSPAALRVSRVGFGCAAIGGYDYGKTDDAVSIRAVRTALRLGVNFFDTADVYGLGHSEWILSKALANDRSNVIVATKGGVAWTPGGQTRKTLDPKYLARAIEASLRRLRIDCIPLYQLHWPDGLTPVTEAIGALLQAREQGKIEAIGLCNFPLDDVRAAQGLTHIVTLQLPASALQTEFLETLRFSWDTWKIGGLCYNVLAQGLFTGKYSGPLSFDGTDLRARSSLFSGTKLDDGLRILRRLSEVAKRVGASPSQVAIRWVLNQNGVSVALTGIKREQQIVENAGAVDVHIGSDDLNYIAEG